MKVVVLLLLGSNLKKCSKQINFEKIQWTPYILMHYEHNVCNETYERYEPNEPYEHYEHNESYEHS